MPINRTPSGVPTGGQFAASERAEATVTSLGAGVDDALVQAAIDRAKRTGKPVRIEAGLPHSGYRDGAGESSCGDTSLGTEPSNRATWATGNDDEPFITVTTTYFVVGRRDSDDHDLDYDDWNDHMRAAKREGDQICGEPEAVEQVRYAVECQTEWISHTDVDDPSHCEQRSDYTYEHGSAINYLTLETAETVARNKAQGEDWSHYYPENWKAA